VQFGDTQSKKERSKTESRSRAAISSFPKRRFSSQVSPSSSPAATRPHPWASFTVPDHPRTPGSIGYPVPGVELALVDDDGRFVTTPGTRGKICGRGDNVKKGYWRNPDAASEAIVDGWFRIGDIGVFDADGAFRIVDREGPDHSRRLQRLPPGDRRGPAPPPGRRPGRGGRRADAHNGEEVMAVVVLKPGATAGPRDMVAWCRTRLAGYKRPHIVEVRDNLPLGPTGKALKPALRASARSQAA
jgi:long-chain acyl-CoA synthetase